MSAFSVIIPVLNEQDYLPYLLQSIIDQRYKGDYEVIIVDGGSVDATKQVAESYIGSIPNLTFLSHKRGVSAQRNYGATKARYPNIIFLDADMLLTKGTLQKISSYFIKSGDFIATPKFLPYDGKPVDTFLARLGNSYIRMNSRTHPVVCGMCIITTKQVHEQLGGFDETLRYAEDIDYGLRAHKNGVRYSIFSDVLLKSSTRRLQTTSRLRLGKLWLSWHIGAIRKGAKSLQGNSDYVYGKFKK